MDSTAPSKKRRLPKDESDDDDKEEDETEPTVTQHGKKYERLPAHGEHKRAVSSVKLAPSRLCRNRNGAALAVSSSSDGTCKVWDLADMNDGNEYKLSKSSSSRPSNDAAASGGTTPHESSSNIVTSSGSGGSPARSVLTPIVQCVGHSRGINEVSWNPVTPVIATASDDKTVRLWDACVGESVVELRGHDNFVFSVDQHSNTVATGSFDETVKLWDVRTGDCVSTLPAHSDPVTAVSFSRDGTTVSSASHDGLIRIWDVATGECLKTIYAAGNPPVSSCRYAPNSKYLLAGTLDSTLRLWPVTCQGTNACAKTYRDKTFVNSKYSVVADFTHDGNIVVGSETGDVVLFDLQTRKVQQVLQGHNDAVLAVSAHDKLPLICSGAMTEDRRVDFWSQDYVPKGEMKDDIMSN